jgi:hypothetical protein
MLREELDGNTMRPHVEALLTNLLIPSTQEVAVVKKRPRARPRVIVEAHLWISLVVSVLLGMNSFQQLWRRMCSQVLGPFQPIDVSDDALVKRLKQAGVAPLQQLVAQIWARLAEQLSHVSTTPLAPFATRILSVDESTWDAMQRHLASQRGLPDGDPALLPGKVAGRFNIRTQQWDAHPVPLRAASQLQGGAVFLAGRAAGLVLAAVRFGLFQFSVV